MISKLENRPSTSEWEKRFSKLWETDSQIYDKIVDFIQKLLSQAKSEAVGGRKSTKRTRK